MPDKNQQELDRAWRLWHQLVELSESIWRRYEDEFIERHLAEEERRERIQSDSLIDQSYPF